MLQTSIYLHLKTQILQSRKPPNEILRAMMGSVDMDQKPIEGLDCGHVISLGMQVKALF